MHNMCCVIEYTKCRFMNLWHEKSSQVHFNLRKFCDTLYNRIRRILAYLPSRLKSRYKRVKFVRRTHNYLSLRAARFRNRRNDCRGRGSNYAYRNAAAACRRTQPCLVFIDGLISRNFRDEAPIARDLFTSARHVARSPPGAEARLIGWSARPNCN